MARESRLAVGGTTVTEETHHGSLISFGGRTELGCRRQIPLTTASRQLDLVLDDARLRGRRSADRR
jgi:hypothetical protein